MSRFGRIDRAGSEAAARSGARRATRSRLIFAAGLFLLFEWLEDFSFFQMAAYQLSRRDIAYPEVNALVYAATYVVCLLGLVVLYTHSWGWLRNFSYAVTGITVAVFLGFKSTNGYGFTYHEASLIWSEPGNIGDSLRFYARDYLLPVLVAFGLVVVLALLLRFLVPRHRSWLLLVFPVLGLFLGHDLLWRTRGKVYQLPIPYRVPLLANYTYGLQILYYGRREAPFIEPAGQPLADHIVFIMDESISGDLLGVNDPRYENTPYLDSISGQFLNFGIVPSISNLTSTSSIVLQSGLRPDQFPDTTLRSLKNPNIFAYMQRAGFRSFLIDAQHYSDRPWNFMTGFDIAALDGYVLVREFEAGAVTHEMDFKAIDYLERVVAQNERSFSYVFKTGAHIPYDDKYPPETAVVEFPGEGAGRGRTRVMTHYLNALHWTVDCFLEELLARLDTLGRRTIVVFTSDHGQSIQRSVDQAPIKWTHAIVVDPPMEQAMVPLFIFGLGPGTQAKLDALFDPSLRGRVSSFELFPSLLYLAGYDEVDIQRHYHHTLFDRRPSRERRIFISGNLFGMGAAFYNHMHVRDSGYANEFRLPASAEEVEAGGD